jgi:hypothetical protein
MQLETDPDLLAAKATDSLKKSGLLFVPSPHSSQPAHEMLSCRYGMDVVVANLLSNLNAIHLHSSTDVRILCRHLHGLSCGSQFAKTFVSSSPSSP